ncbi:hypothetical protein D3C81_1657660 [compost metagenome]
MLVCIFIAELHLAEFISAAQRVYRRSPLIFFNLSRGQHLRDRINRLKPSGELRIYTKQTVNRGQNRREKPLIHDHIPDLNLSLIREYAGEAETQQLK